MEQNATQSGGANDFGRRLRQARLAKFLSLDQLAKRLGVSKVAVWSWEKGKTRPRRHLHGPLSVALGIGEESLALATSGPKLSDVVAGCQEVISAHAGVKPESVEIKIHFGGGDDTD